MSSIPYYNRSGPFWDFAAEVDEQEAPHGRRGDRHQQRHSMNGDEQTHFGPWGQRGAHRMGFRGRHAHGPAHHGPAYVHAAHHGPGHHGPGRRGHRSWGMNRDVEMQDPTSETENEDKANKGKAAELTGSDNENEHSGNEHRHGPGFHRRGGMGGRGRGLGLGGRGGRGGMGAFRHRQAKTEDAEIPVQTQSDGENAVSGDEFHPGLGMRRGGRFAGRARSWGGPRTRAAGAGPQEVDAAMPSDGETARPSGPSGRGGRWGGRGRGLGGPRARAREAGEDGKEIFTPEHSGDENAVSGEENAISGDEGQRGPAGRGGRGHGRGRGMGMRGRGMGPRGHHHHHHQMRNANRDTFTPAVDVFDHSEAFIIHASLPGAKKQDVNVDWDAERSALKISGTVTRPGDEEVLKTIAMEERKSGKFERVVKLGDKDHPAQVDVDGITAKLEDGILRIEVPKTDGGFVEVKKVDVA